MKPHPQEAAPLPPYLVRVPEVDAAFRADPFSRASVGDEPPKTVREGLALQRCWALNWSCMKVDTADAEGRVETFRAIVAAPLFMFSDQVRDAIVAAPEHPPTVFGPELLPFLSPSFFIFDGAAHCIGHERGALNVISYIGEPDGFSRATIPDGTSSVGRKDDTGVLLKIFAFLRGPCSAVERVQQPRADRRRLEKAGLPPPEVSVVTLRRLAQAAPESSAKTEPGRFHFQWWVRSHYREQWFPSEQAHKTVLIVEHVKGPAGAPFRPRVYRVAR